MKHIDLTKVNGIDSVADKMSGVWCIEGTRVPLATIFAELTETGASLLDIAGDYSLDFENLAVVFNEIGMILEDHVATDEDNKKFQLSEETMEYLLEQTNADINRKNFTAESKAEQELSQALDQLRSTKR